MLSVERLPEIATHEKMVGTAAELTKLTHTWFISVPNGFYDVKIYLKLVPTPHNISMFTDNKNLIALYINEELHEPAAMALDDEIVIDNPNLGVT